jgi:hypothetical protein
VIDVFLCVANYHQFLSNDFSRIRYTGANLCHARWMVQPDCDVHVITPMLLGCTNKEFQKERRVYAEKTAVSEVYVVADDDCLLSGGPTDFWAQRVLQLFKTYEDFAILSAWPVNCNIQPWTPEGYEPVHDSFVMEHYSVGGIRFCRAGAMRDWPEQRGSGYDGSQCEWLRSAGWRVGYLRSACDMLHLGEGRDLSTIWRVL